MHKLLEVKLLMILSQLKNNWTKYNIFERNDIIIFISIFYFVIHIILFILI